MTTKVSYYPDAAPNQGFSLIEIIVVLILMGILTAVAVPRMMDNSVDERADADKLKVHLRYAQMQALNSDKSWGIQASGGSYFLYHDGNTDNKAAFPAENSDQVSFNTSVSPSFTISFDGWGRPYTDTDSDPEVNTPFSSTRTISIGSESISITPETGFIP